MAEYSKAMGDNRIILLLIVVTDRFPASLTLFPKIPAAISPDTLRNSSTPCLGLDATPLRTPELGNF